MPNKVFSFFVFTTFLLSEDIYHKVGDKSIKYFKSRNIYFLYNEYLETDGTIIIDGDIKFPRDFAKKYNLDFLKRNSTGTLVFRDLSGSEVIELCNRLQNLSGIKSVEPNWKRERRVK